MGVDSTTRVPSQPLIPSTAVRANAEALTPDVAERDPIGYSWFLCLASVENEFKKSSDAAMLLFRAASKRLQMAGLEGQGAQALGRSAARFARQMNSVVMSGFEGVLEFADWTNYASARLYIAEESISKINVDEQTRRESQFLGRTGAERFAT